MQLDEILKMNPKSECKIHFEGGEYWRDCSFQYAPEITDIGIGDVNDLPLLDDEYLEDAGSPLYNDNNQAVYDPNEEIEYEDSLKLIFKGVYTSKTFISLMQKKIKEVLKDSEVDPYDDDYDDGLQMVLEEMDINFGAGILDMLKDEIKCNDLVCIEEIGVQNYYTKIPGLESEMELLWFTSSQLDEEYAEIFFEEI